MPNPKIILLQRHPMDACWAIYKALFQGKFFFAYDQIELTEYYLAYRRLSRHWRATLSPHVIMDINYEDIVRDQRAASHRLIAFLGLPWDEEVLRFHESQAPSATASAVQVPADLCLIDREMAAPCGAARAIARAPGARNSGQ